MKPKAQTIKRVISHSEELVEYTREREREKLIKVKYRRNVTFLEARKTVESCIKEKHLCYCTPENKPNQQQWTTRQTQSSCWKANTTGTK